MSKCNNNHLIKDGKGGAHINAWHCPECRRINIRNVGLFLLAFSVPTFYILFKNTVIGGSGEESGMSIGLWMIVITWWTLLGVFFYYKEETNDLKYELLKMNAVNRNLTREEIRKIPVEDLDHLAHFLEYSSEQEKEDLGVKSLKAMSYNIKALNLLTTSFDEYIKWTENDGKDDISGSFEEKNDFFEHSEPRKTKDIVEDDILNAVKNKMTWEEINELSTEDLEKLVIFLKCAKEKEKKLGNTNAVKAIKHNIKEITDYLEGEQYWNDDNE